MEAVRQLKLKERHVERQKIEQSKCNAAIEVTQHMNNRCQRQVAAAARVQNYQTRLRSSSRTDTRRCLLHLTAVDISVLDTDRPKKASVLG